MKIANAKFSVGQLIKHKLFDYRGVIADVDPTFQGSEEWYEQMTRTRPPKDKPWYKVLVHDSVQETYVAERNLTEDDNPAPVNHPMVPLYFQDFLDGSYRRNQDS